MEITHLVLGMGSGANENVYRRVEPDVEGPGWVKKDVTSEPSGMFCSANKNRVYKAVMISIQSSVCRVANFVADQAIGGQLVVHGYVTSDGWFAPLSSTDQVLVVRPRQSRYSKWY